MVDGGDDQDVPYDAAQRILEAYLRVLEVRILLSLSPFVNPTETDTPFRTPLNAPSSRSTRLHSARHLMLLNDMRGSWSRWS